MFGPTMFNPVLAVAAKKRQLQLRQRCLPAVRTRPVRIRLLYKAKVQPWCYLQHQSSGSHNCSQRAGSTVYFEMEEAFNFPHWW